MIKQIIPLIILMLHTNFFCMNKNLYQTHDLAMNLKTQIFPKAGDFHKYKYFTRASISTIYKNKKIGDKDILYTFSKNTKTGEYILVAGKAFHIAFQINKGKSHYAKRYSRKEKEIKEVWELLQKKLEEKLQESI